MERIGTMNAITIFLIDMGIMILMILLWPDPERKK